MRTFLCLLSLLFVATFAFKDPWVVWGDFALAECSKAGIKAQVCEEFQDAMEEGLETERIIGNFIKKIRQQGLRSSAAMKKEFARPTSQWLMNCAVENEQAVLTLIQEELRKQRGMPGLENEYTPEQLEYLRNQPPVDVISVDDIRNDDSDEVETHDDL